MIWIFGAWVMAYAIFAHACGSAASAPEPRPPPKTGGGPCEYKTYPGRSEIISVERIALPRGHPGPPHDTYEVWFRFIPDHPIAESHGRVDGKPQLLTLANSWHPGPRFLEKYGIAPGRVFPCNLKVITRGTCSPRVFEFPGIDRGDYFESRNQGEKR